MCLEMYELDTAKFLSAHGLASSFKKTKVKLELLTDIDMLLMVGKELQADYVILLIDMQKLIINISRIMIKIKNLYILNISM